MNRKNQAIIILDSNQIISDRKIIQTNEPFVAMPSILKIAKNQIPSSIKYDLRIFQELMW